MVLAQVSERLRHAHSLRALDAESAEKRVAATLLWLHQKTGGVLTISRKEIAEIAGVAPETAIRTVLAFKKEGWLDATARAIVLKRPQSLQDLVQAYALPLPLSPS